MIMGVVKIRVLKEMLCTIADYILQKQGVILMLQLSYKYMTLQVRKHNLLRIQVFKMNSLKID